MKKAKKKIWRRPKPKYVCMNAWKKRHIYRRRINDAKKTSIGFSFTVWVFIHINTRETKNKRKKEKHYKCSLFCCVSFLLCCGFAYSRAFLIDEGLGCELGHIKRLISLQVNCRKCFELELNHSVVSVF